MSQGFIYVLINPSMPGLCKVGKTTRSTQERSAEISSATGVPSPFIVVYEQPVEDCHAVEKWVHAELDRRNFRAANNREFFNAPIHEIVDVILTAKDIKIPADSYASSPQKEDNVQKISEEISALADKYLRGIDGVPRDAKKALQLYEQAAQLGDSYASDCAAELLAAGKDGIKKDLSEAIKYLKMGVSQNPHNGWANNGKIGRFYSEINQPDSAIPHWKELLKHIDHNTSEHIIAPLWRYCLDVATGKIQSEIDEAKIGLHGQILIFEINQAETEGSISPQEMRETKEFIIHCVGQSWP